MSALHLSLSVCELMDLGGGGGPMKPQYMMQVVLIELAMDSNSYMEPEEIFLP